MTSAGRKASILDCAIRGLLLLQWGEERIETFGKSAWVR